MLKKISNFFPTLSRDNSSCEREFILNSQSHVSDSNNFDFQDYVLFQMIKYALRVFALFMTKLDACLLVGHDFLLFTFIDRARKKRYK